MKKSTCKKTVKEKETAKVTKKKEQETGKEYKWNLSDIYKDYKEWGKDYRKVEKQAEELVSYKGKLGEEKALLEFFKKQEEMDTIYRKFYPFPPVS